METSHQWPQFLAVFFAAFLAIGSGIQMGWPSPSVPRLLSGELGFDVSSDEASYVVMISPLGYLIGSPLFGFLLDAIGRKYTLLMIAPFQILSFLIIILSGNVISLCVARILMGVADSGLYTALPAYIGEITEPKVRGVASTGLSLGILVGGVLVNSYGSYTSIKASAYISLITPIVFIITFIWMPESPYFLLSINADRKARNSLKSLRRMKEVDEELGCIKTAVQRQMTESGRLIDVFTVHSNFKAFLILAALRTIQQFSGIFAIAYYMQTIFELADSVLTPEVSTILCNAIRIPITFIGSLMIDRLGRRIMISISSFGSALCLATMATYFYLQTTSYDMEFIRWLPLATMITFYVFCSMGLLVVPTLMMGELLPTNIKAKALGIMNMYFGLCISAATKLFQWTESRFGAYVPFYLFAAVCLFGIVFVYIFVPETKGKSLEEIQSILKGPENKPDKNRLVSAMSTPV